MDPSFAPESAGEQSELYGPSIVDGDNNACLHDGRSRCAGESRVRHRERRASNRLGNEQAPFRAPLVAPAWVGAALQLANRWGVAAASATREKTTGAPLS
jgi:hypothetical protein